MAKSESNLVIWGAIVANALIAVAKFVAASFTGSSAMVAEAIHSTVDAADGALLLLGVHRSRRTPDAMHPFGHGRELYFWSLIVAIVIFGAGGGMSIYEGIVHIMHPAHIQNAIWSYGVLGFAALFEGISWVIAVRHFLATKPAGRGVVETIRRSKDPTQFVVLLEDSAALVGIAIAFAGTALAEGLRNPLYDGLASALIGLVLCAVAVILIWETRGLLIGESVDREQTDAIREIVMGDPAVEDVSMPMTMYLGADDVLLNLSLRFRRNLDLPEIEEAIRRIETAIRQRFSEIRRIYIEAASLEHVDTSGRR